MTRMVSGNRINQRWRSLAGNVTSGRGIFVQLLGCQLVLPAIAQEAQAVPVMLPETEANYEYSTSVAAHYSAVYRPRESVTKGIASEGSIDREYVSKNTLQGDKHHQLELSFIPSSTLESSPKLEPPFKLNEPQQREEAVIEDAEESARLAEAEESMPLPVVLSFSNALSDDVVAHSAIASGDIAPSKITPSDIEPIETVIPLDLVPPVVSSEPSSATSLPEAPPIARSEIGERNEPESWLAETGNLNESVSEQDFSNISLSSSTLSSNTFADISFSNVSPIDLSSDHSSILIAGPQRLNPGLVAPTPTPATVSPAEALPPDPSNAPSTEASPTDVSPMRDRPAETSQPNRFITWEGLSVGFDSNFDSFNQANWQISPVLQGMLANGDRLSIATHFGQFSQPDIESIAHLPLTVNWQGERGKVTVEASAGVDFFDRLPTDTHFKAKVSAPISTTATVAVGVEQGPYTFNAQTLDNQISRWRYGPEIYWQITPKTSFLSLLNLDSHSDGNQAQQSFSRLERTIGEAATAAINITTASYDQNVIETSGYFSPANFLVVSAELSWQESISDDLTCGLKGSIGQQRLEGEWAVAYQNQAVCSVQFSPAAQLDIGYRISNTSNGQALFSDSAYSNQSIFGGVRIEF